VEFHIHGSKAIQSKFLEELASLSDFRMAEPVFFILSGNR